MISITADSRLLGRVLAVEPDPYRGRRLKAVLDTRLGQAAHIVASAEEAIRALERELPDLVLTSSFLSPAAVRTLTAHLRSRPDASHVPVLITPQLADAQSAAAPSPRFGWLRRPHSLSEPCEPPAFLQQLDEYFQQARAARAARDLVVPVSRVVDAAEMPIVEHPHSIVLRASASDGGPTPGRPSDRRRMVRLRHEQLPWLSVARLPWGSDVDVVDVSRSGVLVETTSRMTPGTVVDLEFLGKDLNATVPSRILRTSVGHVDRLGVRYRVAAAFTRDFGLIDSVAASDGPLNATAVGEILARTLAGVRKGTNPASTRSRFEHEVQRLVPVCTVRIQQGPTGDATGDSIYFSIPSASGTAVLQATFDRARPPSAMEFRVLKSAVYLAAVLLEFAPFGRDCELRALA
jgi:CheY-like chemotaxis protein